MVKSHRIVFQISPLIDLGTLNELHDPNAISESARDLGEGVD